MPTSCTVIRLTAVPILLCPECRILCNDIIDPNKAVCLEEHLCLSYRSIETQISSRPHEDDLITQMKILRCMRNQDRRLIPGFGKTVQQHHQIFFCTRVESRCRLVQEEKLRICQKLYCDTCSLFLSSGQFTDKGIFVL